MCDFTTRCGHTSALNNNSLDINNDIVNMPSSIDVRPLTLWMANNRFDQTLTYSCQPMVDVVLSHSHVAKV